MGGAQSQIYDDAHRFLRRAGAELEPMLMARRSATCKHILDDPRCYQGNRMTEAKTLLDALQMKVDASVAAGAGRNAYQGRANAGNDSPAWPSLRRSRVEQQDRIATTRLMELNAHIERQTLIAVMRDTLRHFD